MKRVGIVSSFACSVLFVWASSAEAQSSQAAEPPPAPSDAAAPADASDPRDSADGASESRATPALPSEDPGEGEAPKDSTTSNAAPDSRAASRATTVDKTAGGTLTVTGPAMALDRDAEANEEPPKYDFIRLNAGIRVGYVTTRGFDAFGSNDVLPQFSIDGTYPLLARGSFVLGAGLGWDAGRSSAPLRGLETSLSTHRFYVPVEGRLHFAPSIFAFAKVSPGAAMSTASVQDGSSPKELSGTGWAFAADVSVGASILMGPRQASRQRKVRFWITPEVGYAYTTKAPMRLSPGRADDEVLGSDESMNLRGLALSGVFWRASLGATF